MDSSRGCVCVCACVCVGGRPPKISGFPYNRAPQDTDRFSSRVMHPPKAPPRIMAQPEKEASVDVFQPPGKKGGF